MPVLITYDVPRRHLDLKQRLAVGGYLFQLTDPRDNKVFYLPNTALYHQSKTVQQAMSDLKAECSYLGISLERAFATEVGSVWDCIPGNPYSTPRL